MASDAGSASADHHSAMVGWISSSHPVHSGAMTGYAVVRNRRVRVMMDAAGGEDAWVMTNKAGGCF